MGRARTGTIERDGLVVYARVTLANGRRPRVRLPDGVSDADALARQKLTPVSDGALPGARALARGAAGTIFEGVMIPPCAWYMPGI